MKILTDKEMIDIIKRAPDEIDDGDAYKHFLGDLGCLIADHFGSRAIEVSEPDDIMDDYTCSFAINEQVPDDGGIFKYYDKDVVWENGKEC
jgi:hypothetical protein